ncbi:MAG: hypothetical protein HC890_13935 [Chloroflexaceae bacterium]|nr:hypothetical protein [Chloroflexaceae bacterium]
MSSSDVFLTNDFENGSLGSWRLESPKSSAIQVSSAESRGGNKSLQFTLNQSDPIVNNGKRAEIKQPYTAPGTEQWYGFSLFLPDNFVSDREREIVAQWHSKADTALGEGLPGAPPLALHTINGEWQLLRRWDSKPITEKHKPEGSQNIDLGQYQTGEWTDWVFHVKWSHKSDGLVEVWKDGKLVVRETGPNTYNDQIGPNFKLGIYKPGWRDRAENSSVRQRTLFVDEVRLADQDATFADVDPATHAGRKPGTSSQAPLQPLPDTNADTNAPTRTTSQNCR